MKESYMRGFLTKCAADGIPFEQSSEMLKRALDLKAPPSGYNNAVLGAVLGGSVGLAREAFANKKRKDYLKSLIISSVLGTGVGLLSSYAGAPDVWNKMKPVLGKIKDKAVGTARGAYEGFKGS